LQGLSFKPCKDFFACEGSLFKFDLIGCPIYCEIPAQGEGEIIFRPNLPDIFSTELFKDFAFIVDRLFYNCIKPLFRADQLRAFGQKEDFLFSGGIEAKTVPAAVFRGRLVKGEDIGENFGSGGNRVHIAFEDEAENVIVRICEAVIAIDQIVQ